MDVNKAAEDLIKLLKEGERSCHTCIYRNSNIPIEHCLDCRNGDNLPNWSKE